MSKRTREHCQAPAIKGKTKCRFHGGRLTAPKTKAGRARIAATHSVHGRETRWKRADTSAKFAELYALEMLGRKMYLVLVSSLAFRKVSKEVPTIFFVTLEIDPHP